MEPRDVFFLGLGLTAPWTLVGQRLDVDKRPQELHLEVGAERGSRFACAECKRACKAHDFESFTWQHLNFFQHHCFITARVPRVDCPEHGVKRVQVPWARPGSHFTLLFEHAALVLVREMPVASAAGFMGITDKRLWRIVGHYVGRAVAELDLSGVRAFGLDETASKKGHNYVTVFIDMDRSDKPVIFVTPGKGKACVAEFRDFLLAHDGEPTNVAEVVCDMSSAFLAAVAEGFPKAAVTVDWFHVVQLFTTAVDDVRKAPFVRLRSPHPHAPQGHPLGGAESRRWQPHRRPAHCARRAGALSVITLFDGVGIEHFDGLGWRFGVATRSSVWLWSRFSSACRPLAKAERCVGCKRWVRANGAACGFVDNAARYPQLHRPISDQGCSTLFEVFHREQGFEAAEGGGVAILGDGVGLIEAQDIVSEGAYSGEDARVAADARFIFAEGDVARVVLLVFDAPVVANGGGGLFGMDRAIGQVERALE